MRFFVIMIILTVIGMSVSFVSAADSICNYNSSLHLNKSDLPEFMSDQAGCFTQKISDGSEILVISGFALIILVIAYGILAGKKR